MKKNIRKKDSAKQGKTKPPEKSGESQSRRSFLKRLWAGLGVFAGIEFIAAVFAFLFSGKRNLEYKPKQLVTAGNVNSFKPNSVTPFRGGRFYLVRLPDSGFIALSLRCTHLGCSVAWEEKNNRFICPCHSSSFDITGEVQNPPAPKALDYYPVFIEQGIVKVDVGIKKERQRFLKDQVVYV
ncbi:ubiquinol-cytochrome c reductase iron-sulfur subunit [Bacteroidota bacterium]